MATNNNNYGGDRTCHRHYTDDELVQLAKTCFDNDNDLTLTSLFSSRQYQTKSAWLNDIGRHVHPSNRIIFHHNLYILRNGNPTCKFCKVVLDHTYLMTISRGQYRDACSSCINLHMHTRGESIGEQRLQERGKKISKRKKEFFQSERGKEVAKIVGEKTQFHLRHTLSLINGSVYEMKYLRNNQRE